MPVRVVLVDDVPELRAALRRALLLRGGFEVVAEADHGVGAIAACGRHQPDVVVLDLGLPDLAGRDVLTRIRNACPQVRVVVTSGTHTLATAGIREPVEAFVEKRRDVAYVVDLLADVGSGVQRTAAVALSGDLTDVSAARRLVNERCLSWGCAFLADDASLVVSELISNAIVHAGTGCVLTLHYRSPILRVEVQDQGDGMPDLQVTGIGDEHGRGLLLVSALCTAWGAEPTASAGKRVWAELTVTQGGAAGDVRPAGLQAG